MQVFVQCRDSWSHFILKALIDPLHSEVTNNTTGSTNLPKDFDRLSERNDNSRMSEVYTVHSAFLLINCSPSNAVWWTKGGEKGRGKCNTTIPYCISPAPTLLQTPRTCIFLGGIKYPQIFYIQESVFLFCNLYTHSAMIKSLLLPVIEYS